MGEVIEMFETNEKSGHRESFSVSLTCYDDDDGGHSFSVECSWEKGTTPPSVEKLEALLLEASLTIRQPVDGGIPLGA